ncbi:hypothetical protein D3C81_1314190 [compost metagenome]
MINEHTITLVGNIERNVLVSLFGACASILVPDIYNLPIPLKSCETLPKSIYPFPDTKIKLFTHVGISFGVCNVCCRFESAARKTFCTSVEIKRPHATLGNTNA